MFKFPFLADVWGTVSDWIMVSVTTITAYFLYKTLKSQKEVQDTQLRLFEIERVRIREEYKPKLKFIHEPDLLHSDDPAEVITTIRVRNESNNLALNVIPIYSPKGDATPIAVLSNPKNLIKGEYEGFYHFKSDKTQELLFIVFGLQYEDVSGLKYKQSTLIVVDSFGVTVTTYLPELLTVEENK